MDESKVTRTSMTFNFYDNYAERYGITIQKVAALVKKYGLTKRRIYGSAAVESEKFIDLMRQLGYQEK